MAVGEGLCRPSCRFSGNSPCKGNNECALSPGAQFLCVTKRRFAAHWFGIEKEQLFLRFVPNLLRLGVWIGRWLGKEGQGAFFEGMGRLHPLKPSKLLVGA